MKQKRPEKERLGKFLLRALFRLETNGYLCGGCDYHPIKDCEFECPLIAELLRFVREGAEK